MPATENIKCYCLFVDKNLDIGNEYIKQMEINKLWSNKFVKLNFNFNKILRCIQNYSFVYAKCMMQSSAKKGVQNFVYSMQSVESIELWTFCDSWMPYDSFYFVFVVVCVQIYLNREYFNKHQCLGLVYNFCYSFIGTA